MLGETGQRPEARVVAARSTISPRLEARLLLSGPDAVRSPTDGPPTAS